MTGLERAVGDAAGLGAPSERVEAEEFLSALISGAPWAAEQAWKRYSGLVYDVMLRGLGAEGDLDDAVQEVFFRLFRRVQSLRDATALRSFVFSIAVRVMRWQLRHRLVRRCVQLSDSGVLPELSQQPVDVLAREAVRHLDAVVRRLRPADRRIFVLHQLEDMSVSQIARTVGMSQSTVKRRLGRATLRVRRWAEAEPLG